MKRFALFFAGAMMLVGMTGCSDNPDENVTVERQDIELSQPQKVMAKKCDNFAFTLLRAVYDNTSQVENGNQINDFFSPLSVANSLAMIACSTDGEARREITDALGVKNDDLQQLADYCTTLNRELLKVDNNVNLYITNSFQVTDTTVVKSTFGNTLKEYFNVDVTLNPYPAIINPELTHQDMLGVYSDNDVSFRGKWFEGYEFKKVDKDVFHNANGTTSVVDMMSGEVNAFGANLDGVDYARMYFGNRAFCITFIKPSSDNMTLDDYVSTLTYSRWEEMADWFMMNFDGYGQFDMTMPKLEINSTYSDDLFEQIMGELGITKIYTHSPEWFAPLTDQPVAIGLGHTGHFKLDETGVEAIVHTGGGVSAPSITRINAMKLDRPYMFIISEVSTKAILFMGCVKHL